MIKIDARDEFSMLVANLCEDFKKFPAQMSK